MCMTNTTSCLMMLESSVESPLLLEKEDGEELSVWLRHPIGQKVPSHSHHVVDNIPQAPKDFPPIRLRLNVANEGSFTSSFVTAPIHAFAKSLSPIILPLFLSLLAFGLLIFLTRVATALPASS